MVKRIIGTISLIIGVIGIAALLFVLSNYDGVYVTTRGLVLPIIASFIFIQVLIRQSSQLDILKLFLDRIKN